MRRPRSRTASAGGTTRKADSGSCGNLSKEKPRREAGVSFVAYRERLLGGGDGRSRAIHQLDVGHRRVVAGAEAALEDAQVATRARLVARTEFDEQLAHGLRVAQAGHRE